MIEHLIPVYPGQVNMAFVFNRKRTRQVNVGNVSVGDMAPIAVQSMTTTPTADVDATVSQIKRLQNAGCEIVRVAVPDHQAAEAVRTIKKEISIPLIADIHFDHRLAIAATLAGADALRINPGNIGSAKKVKAVVDCAGDAGISIRIGVNSPPASVALVPLYRVQGRRRRHPRPASCPPLA